MAVAASFLRSLYYTICRAVRGGRAAVLCLSELPRRNRRGVAPEPEPSAAGFRLGVGVGGRRVESPVVPGEAVGHHPQVDVLRAEKGRAEDASAPKERKVENVKRKTVSGIIILFVLHFTFYTLHFPRPSPSRERKARDTQIP